MSTAPSTSELPITAVHAPAIARRYTADELLALTNDKDFELVDGRLVERHMGAESSCCAAEILYLIRTWAQSRLSGHIFMADCGYQCFPGSPDKVRKPDVSFIRYGRLPGEVVPKGHIAIAPDLAVEVLSPNDLASEVDIKVQEYLRAGVRLVWVVQPESRTVLIHRADGTISGLRETDELSGEDVLPSFLCRVQDIFRQSVTVTP